VTSPERTAIARRAAAEGTVLLKNSNRALPLARKKGLRLAVFGSAATAKLDAMCGGGSGVVDPAHNGVTVLDGLRKELDVFGGSVTHIIAGQPSSMIEHAVGDNDAALIVLATTSKEGEDRHSLSYNVDDLRLVNQTIAAARHSQKKVYVVCISPGAILLPFADEVDALVMMFMPGQTLGDALVDVLFGAVNPSGRLPVTIPQRLGAMPTFTPQQWPGVGRVSTYSEGMHIGYRWYDHHNVEPRFPFGFGLSYTSFDYHLADNSLQSTFSTSPDANPDREWHLDVQIENTGEFDGNEVAQMYLERTNCSTSIRPPRQLVAFTRVHVPRHSSVLATLRFKQSVVNEWSVEKGSWVPPEPACTYTLRVGSSSRDFRVAVEILF